MCVGEGGYKRESAWASVGKEGRRGRGVEGERWVKMLRAIQGWGKSGSAGLG